MLLAGVGPNDRIESQSKKETNRMVFKVSMRIDLGRDLGQNFGSLFEETDELGNVVAGVGFLGVHNTEARSDRRNLHFFLKPQQTDYAGACRPERSKAALLEQRRRPMDCG